MNIIFQSCFKVILTKYLDFNVNLGYSVKTYQYFLTKFDRFADGYGCKNIEYTKEMHAEWSVVLPEEHVPTTHYRRMNMTKHLLIFLMSMGYKIYMPRDTKFIPSTFKPHIYSDIEIEKYFYEVDHAVSYVDKSTAIIFPVMFRLLYCCGLRISECLRIKMKDYHPDEATIVLYETKFDGERIIALSHELNDLLRNYGEKCFYLKASDDYLFFQFNGKKFGADSIYEWHRKFLERAGIPYQGDRKGPRLHDWRHTFSTKTMAAQIISGKDMYCTLPILSAYLGHRTIFATEKYVQLTKENFPEINQKMIDKMDEIFKKVGGNDEG
ncbi:tyrosine-type recombinase/integrase [Enterococcus sp. DIV0187]|uniref:tyrosine-type recombinase/integrase n=1 Tax=Enterococcus sp. DIV0187 TaxID=2774644 RepID=UPI003F26D397